MPSLDLSRGPNAVGQLSYKVVCFNKGMHLGLDGAPYAQVIAAERPCLQEGRSGKLPAKTHINHAVLDLTFHICKSAHCGLLLIVFAWHCVE